MAKKSGFTHSLTCRGPRCFSIMLLSSIWILKKVKTEYPFCQRIFSFLISSCLKAYHINLLFQCCRRLFYEVYASVTHDEQFGDPLSITDIQIIARAFLLSRFSNKHIILYVHILGDFVFVCQSLQKVTDGMNHTVLIQLKL